MGAGLAAGSHVDDSTGRVLIERIVAGTSPARGVEWVPLKNSGHELRRHRASHGEAYTAGLMYERAVAVGCDGLVLLRDADGRDDRRALNLTGLADAQGRAPRSIPAVLGLQVRTLEAWLLADAGAFAKVLHEPRPDLPCPPEELWGKVRDPTSNHPREVLKRIVRDLRGTCDRHLAARLAEHADLDVMARECPVGFGAFKRDLERAFRPFDCVVAADQANTIGQGGALPWPRLKEDLRFLRDKTTTAQPGVRNAVIMGRKTWDSMPAKFRPLPGRVNVVVTRDPAALAARGEADGRDVVAVRSLDDALTHASLRADVDRLFVIGGGELFRQAFVHPRCRDLYLTRIDHVFGGDAFMPDPSIDFALAEVLAAHHDAGFDYRIERWRRTTRLAEGCPRPHREDR